MEKPKLTVRVSEGELAVWREAAWARRASLSDWVRLALDVAASKQAVEGRERGPGDGQLDAGFKSPASGRDDGNSRSLSAAPHASPPKEDKQLRRRAGMCEHRVAAGTFCKKCGSS
jgi:hypothetical protein